MSVPMNWTGTGWAPARTEQQRLAELRAAALADQAERSTEKLRDRLATDPEFVALYHEAADEIAWNWRLFEQPSLLDGAA